MLALHVSSPVGLVAASAVSAGAQGGQHRAPRGRASRTASDSSSAVATVEAFRSALSTGDSAGALGRLSPDVVVLESGDVEHYADYRTHHLPADIAFSRAVPSQHTLVRVQVEGRVAWVTSTSVTQGQFNGRTINSAGAELMVLTRARADAPWLIRAIHWSSHRRQ